MATVEVFRYILFNPNTGEYLPEAANRMATREGIARLNLDSKGAKIIEGTGVHIDEKLVGRDEPGLTDIGFYPHSLT